jgi:hypothetical protein
MEHDIRSLCKRAAVLLETASVTGHNSAQVSPVGPLRAESLDLAARREATTRMRFQIGAMSAGDILDRGLKILLSRLPTFYLINLIVLSPAVLAELLLPTLDQRLIGAPTDFMVGLLNFVLEPLAAAAILHVIAQEFIDQHATLGEAIRFANRRFVGLFGTSLLGSLITFLGLLCVVPGILFLIWFVLVAQVVVVEGFTGVKALGRSMKLTEGHRGRVIGLGLLFFVMMGILMFSVGLFEEVIPSTELIESDRGEMEVLNFRNYAIQVLLSTLLIILVQTYRSVCWTLLYFDLRIRKEGYDIELAARE